MEKLARLKRCIEAVRRVTDFVPEIAVVLGSGLGGFADSLNTVATVNYSEIPEFPVSTVPGHKGRFVFGYIENVPVVVMQGRVHYYEGYSMEECVLPIRLMYMLGARTLFLTNASGGINSDFTSGDFMVIDDHISSFVPNPLIGANIEELGTRFPDMSEVYSKELRQAIFDAAKQQEIDIKHGVYIQFTGPSYESPAEIKMAKLLGADAVGMSTVCEAIAARHMGMKICGISCVANLAAGISKNPLSHEEVQTNMNKAAEQFIRLMKQSVINIANL